MKKVILISLFCVVVQIFSVQTDYYFTQIAQIDFDVWDDLAIDMKIGHGGTIWYVKRSHGLCAYSFNGSNLTEILNIEDINAYRIEIGSDSTIYVAHGSDGLSAYNFNGSNLTEIAHYNIVAYDLAVDSNSNIFIAGEDSISAFNFNGSVFNYISSYNIDRYKGKIIALNNEGIIFTFSQYSTQLLAFEFSSNAFRFIDSVENGTYDEYYEAVSFDSNQTIFSATGDGSVFVYSFYGNSFGELYHSWFNLPYDIAVGFDNTVFMVGEFGLSAFQFDNSTLTTIANHEIRSGVKIVIGVDNIIFVSTVYEGLNKALIAYRYSGYVNIDSNPNIENYNLFQNYPNPFNPETTISYSLKNDVQVNLDVIDIAGREVCKLIDQKQNKGSHQVKFDGSMLTSGIYFYRLSIDGKAVENRKMVFLK